MHPRRQGDGLTFDDLPAVQTWLAGRRVGIIGFCLGGGFSLMLAAAHGYAASAVNYGGSTDTAWDRLASACPNAASYGGDDPTFYAELFGWEHRIEHASESRGPAERLTIH